MPTSATPVQLVNPDTGIPYAASSGTPAATDGSNNRRVVGDSNAGVADSGSAPVKVGGVFTSTLPTLSNGQRSNLQLDASGRLIVKIADSRFARSGFANGYNQFSSFNLFADDGGSGPLNVVNGYQDPVTNNGFTARGDTIGAHVVSKGGASIATGQISVGTTATQVVAARTGRQKVTLSPTSSTVYYVGSTGVTTTTGLYVPAGGTITLDTAAAIFAVGAAALTISYIEFF